MSASGEVKTLELADVVALYAEGRRLAAWSGVSREVLSRCPTSAVPRDQALLDLDFLRQFDGARTAFERNCAYLLGRPVPPQGSPSPPVTLASVAGVLIDDHLDDAEARLAMEAYLGDRLPGWWHLIDGSLGIEGINKSLSDVASGLTDAARVVLVLDRVLEGRRTSIGRRGEALASVESAALPLADQRGPVGARSKAVAAHAAECFGPFGYIPVYQTSYPPRQVKNEAGSLDWQSRLSWPVARARFRDPTTWAAFSRYVPDVPEAARATLRNWLRHAQVLAPSPALLVRWRERRVDEARTISALTGLCPEATWWVPAEYAAPEPVPSRRIRPPGTPPSAGLRTLVMRAVGEHDEALTIYGPTPLPSKVFEGFNGRLSGETGLLPHDPSGLAFDLSPAPEWLRGLR